MRGLVVASSHMHCQSDATLLARCPHHQRLAKSQIQQYQIFAVVMTKNLLPILILHRLPSLTRGRPHTAQPSASRCSANHIASMLPPEQTAPELVLANLQNEVYQRKAYLLLRTLIKPIQCCHDREIYILIPFLEALPRVISIDLQTLLHCNKLFFHI